MVDKEKFAHEDELGYKVHIVAKNFQLTDPMQQHIMGKLGKLERFSTHILDIHVALEIQRVEHACLITCHFNHFKVKVEARSTDMYVSIDQAVQKLQHLFRKWKGKIQDYHKKPAKHIDMTVNVYHRPPVDETEEVNKEIEADNLKDWTPHKVVTQEMKTLKTLHLHEAIMKMELSGDSFLLYRDEKDRKLKLIYRRADGHYGVMEAEE